MRTHRVRRVTTGLGIVVTALLIAPGTSWSADARDASGVADDGGRVPAAVSSFGR